MINEELIAHFENLRDAIKQSKLCGNSKNNLYFDCKIDAYDYVVQLLKYLERE